MIFTAHSLKSDMPQPIKLQIVGRYLPVGLPYGGCTYVEDFLRYLRQEGFEIECILLDPSPGGDKPWYVVPSVIEEFVTISARNNLRFGSILFRLRPLLAYCIAALPRLVYNSVLPERIKNIYRSAKKRRQQIYGHGATTTDTQRQGWDTLATPEEIAFARAQFARFKPDVVIANYAWLGGVLDVLPPDEAVLKVILTHDLLHRRVTGFEKVGVDSHHSNWDWEKESVQLQKAQVLLAIQEEEAKVLKEMAPRSDVICVPMSAVCYSGDVGQVAGRCFFVGSNSPHNTHGLQWFLDNIWPIVLELVPHCNLHVGGTVCDQIRGTFPNVRFLGRVEELKSEYGAAELCIVPLLVGSGLKIKLIEALSNGRACVSTSIGVQGLGEIADKGVLVADTAEDFAAAMHLILTNPDKRRWMEGQARNYVTNRLSPEATYKPFVERVYQHLRQGPSRL